MKKFTIVALFFAVITMCLMPELKAEEKVDKDKKMFDKLDSDSNGSISLDEYCAKCGDDAEKKEKAIEKFKKLDADENGSLTLEEMSAYSKKRGQVINIIKSESVEIPIIIQKDKVPIIECTINGQKAKLLLDTGCNRMSIFDNKIDKFGIKLTDSHAHSYRADGKKLYKVGDKMSVTIGGAVHLDVHNITIVSGTPDNNIDGLFSVILMIGLQSHIDFTSDTLKINLVTKHNKKNTPDKK